MSRQKTDLRPSVLKMTIKSPLPNIHSGKDKTSKESVKVSPTALPATASTNSVKRNGGIDKTDQLMKEIEKWRQKFTASQKALEESRAEVKFKEDHVNTLEQKIKSLTTEYKKSLQAAKQKYGSHTECQSEIDNLKKMLTFKEKEIEELHSDIKNLKDGFEEKLKSAMNQKQEEIERLEQLLKEEKNNYEKQIESQISQLKQLHKEQINAKDEKLNMLKKQIADALTGSSVERQQQIEELLKELKRVSEEAEAVKAALKNVRSKGDCQKCAMYQKKCYEMQEQIKLKDSTINDLIRIGSKMEKNLSQQDDLVAIWNKVKKENDKMK